MATKFCIFQLSIIANPEKVTKITKAACCLHNYLGIAEINRLPSSHLYGPEYVDREDGRGNVIPKDWRTLSPLHALQHIEHI